jgi:hypothetical protein
VTVSRNLTLTLTLSPASIRHSYASVSEHGSAHIKRTALQQIYIASNCKSFAGQPIHSGDFITYQQCRAVQPNLPATVSAHRSAGHDTSSAGQASRNHREAAKKTIAPASHLQREASGKRPFLVAQIAPPSLAQASRYETSLHRYYSDTLPAYLKYPF